MGLFDGLDEAQGFDGMFRPSEPDVGAELLNALHERNHPRAYGCLRRLGEPLEGTQAAACLTAALQCSPGLFRAVLDRCAPGEYACVEQWKLENVLHNRYVNVIGTVLTLAAAMDKTAHMRILLGRGWDVNSASPASAEAVNRQSGGCFAPLMMFGAGGTGGLAKSVVTVGSAEYNSVFKTIVNTVWTSDSCTPLAAAIACGSVAATRLLLRQPGVLIEGSSAVCAAALAALHEGPKQQECLKLAFRLKSEVFRTDDLTRELLRERAVDLTVVARSCNLREFTMRLKGVRCTREELRAATEALQSWGVKKSEKKLLRLIAAHPELGEEQKIRDLVLNQYLRGGGGQSAARELLSCWKRLCGELRDITGVQSYFGDIAVRRDKLDALGEGGTLCAAAESAWLCDWRGSEALTALTDRVRFYRAAGEGISNLAISILDLNDLRALRRMAQRGLLDGEPRGELLAYAAQEKSAPALRAALLSLPKPEAAAEPPQGWEFPEEGVVWRSRLARMSRQELRAWVREAWEQPLDAAACRERLRALEQYGGNVIDTFGWRGGPWRNMWSEQIDGITVNNPVAAACCGKNPELLRLLLEQNGSWEARNALYQVSWAGSGGVLTGTMLCLAAAAGRTRQVRELLDRGFDPNERDRPIRSIHTDGEDLFGTPSVVTPLFMALEKGHRETARLLRERGAVAWPPREDDGVA